MKIAEFGKQIALLAVLVLTYGVSTSGFPATCEPVAQPGTQNRLRAPQSQGDLHLRCVQLGDRAEHDAEAMIPHRSWTWRQDFERSRRQLQQFQRDLIELRGSEAQCEASLTSEQQSKVQNQLGSLKALWKHLESDVQSLNSELLKGYPTRWYVARHTFDMQKESRRWIKQHDRIAASLKIAG